MLPDQDSLPDPFESLKRAASRVGKREDKEEDEEEEEEEEEEDRKEILERFLDEICRRVRDEGREGEGEEEEGRDGSKRAADAAAAAAFDFDWRWQDFCLDRSVLPAPFDPEQLAGLLPDITETLPEGALWWNYAFGDWWFAEPLGMQMTICTFQCLMFKFKFSIFQ